MSLVNRKVSIIAFVSDLFFGSKILSTFTEPEYDLNLIYAVEQLANTHPVGVPKPNMEIDPIPDIVYFLAFQQPDIVIFDINDAQLHCTELLSQMKRDASTRRLPVLAFGSHVDAKSIKLAKEMGADKVVARSKFTTDMVELVEELVVQVDVGEIEDFCQGKLPEKAVAGMTTFNHGDFFEAHEIFEEVWQDEKSHGRDFYRALIQISVAYLQIERGNFRGAVKMFTRVQQWLAKLPDQCRGVDIAALKMEINEVFREVERYGARGIANFDRSKFNKIKYKN